MTLATWLSLAIYLIANSFGVTHSAEFGDKAHKHNGHVCAIQYFVDEAEHGLLGQAPVEPVPVFKSEAQFILAMLSPNFKGELGYKPRAPPVIS